MTTIASMTKEVPAVGVLSNRIPKLFRRHEATERFRGMASFGNGDSSVLLEVADTPFLRQKGMMGRTSMLECCGMLFTDLEGGAFWMKGCRIPLDIVFLDDNDQVSRKYSMKADGGERLYRYGDEKNAIELPYGYCSRHGIDIGTKCEWRTW